MCRVIGCFLQGVCACLRCESMIFVQNVGAMVVYCVVGLVWVVCRVI